MDSGRVDSIIMSQESGSKVKSHLKLMRVKLGGIKPCYFFPDLRVKLVNLLDCPDVGRCRQMLLTRTRCDGASTVAVPEENRHVQPLCPLLS